MNKTDYKDMWVFIERDGDSVLPVSLELCSETRRLCDASGEKLVAVIVGSISDGELQRVLDCGVDKVIHVTGTGYDYFNNDAYTNLFTVLCRKYRPTAVMVGGTINGRDFAPRFAARLGTGCTSDATELVWDPKTTDIEFVEPAVGGKMMAVITVPVARPQVGTIRPGTFKCVPCGARAHEVIEEHIDFPVADIRTEILDFRADDLDESLNIADADVIVCIGNAIKGADALPRYRRLAERLGGKLACTRPVFDRGVLPFKLVIGQSGAVVKPKLLLSFGVSGAVNHVTGFSDADVVVAVNTDPEAAIFNYCTYGIVGDMDEVCEAMLAKLGAGAKDIGMQPMSASDAASSKIRAGQRAYHKTKSKKGPGICQTLFPGTPGWIRTSGLPLRRRPLYPTELRGHNSAILAQRTAGVNDRRLGNGMMRRGRGAVARGGKSWYDKQTAQRR